MSWHRYDKDEMFATATPISGPETVIDQLGSIMSSYSLVRLNFSYELVFRLTKPNKSRKPN